jgi:hypothetical protein
VERYAQTLEIFLVQARRERRGDAELLTCTLDEGDIYTELARDAKDDVRKKPGKEIKLVSLK